MDIDNLLILHRSAVKAAQVYEMATFGTQDKRRKEKAWDKAEKAFEDALNKLER